MVLAALSSEEDDAYALAAAPFDATDETVTVDCSLAIGESDALLAAVRVDLAERDGVNVCPSEGACPPVNTADNVVLGSIDAKLPSLTIGEPPALTLSVRKCVELSTGKPLHVCPRPGDADLTAVPEPPIPADPDTKLVWLGRRESSVVRVNVPDCLDDKVGRGLLESEFIIDKESVIRSLIESEAEPDPSKTLAVRCIDADASLSLRVAAELALVLPEADDNAEPDRDGASVGGIVAQAVDVDDALSLAVADTEEDISAVRVLVKD